MTKNKTTRIGPRMFQVTSYVHSNPGQAMLHAARHAGPNGSTRYGYASVHRAIDAGLVEVSDVRGNACLLTVTDRGRELLTTGK